MQAAEKCLALDLRQGAKLCGCYLGLVGLAQLCISVYLIVRFLYWGMIPSSIIYLLVAAVGLASTNDWKAVLTYAPEVVRAAFVFFVCSAGLTLSEFFATCWRIAYAVVDYQNCINVPGLDKSNCTSQLAVRHLTY
eukprot:scaffold195862_cov24-Prasinocladus_malaysianus.AAC.1